MLAIKERERNGCGKYQAVDWEMFKAIICQMSGGEVLYVKRTDAGKLTKS